MPAKKLRHTTSRYNLTLRTDLYAELQEIAASKGITFVELMRKYIRLGQIVSELEDKPGSKLIIRTNDTETGNMYSNGHDKVRRTYTDFRWYMTPDYIDESKEQS